jgi:hypothetical protein
MTTNTEQALLQLSQENSDRLVRIETAVLDENGEGRLPIAEGRLNDHAIRIRRLEWFAALLIGGACLLLWELKTLTDIMSLAMKARQ